MRIGKDYILVRIDKKAQTKKRSITAGGILLHHNFIFMERNLQFGIVVDMGINARRNYPEGSIGDEVMFHHSVEDDEFRVLGKEPNGDELIYVYAGDENQNYEIYGFVNDSGVYPSQHYVWLQPSVTRIKMRPQSDLLILETEMGDDWDSRDRLTEKIEELDQERKMLEPSIKATRIGYTFEQELARRTEVINKMNEIQEQRGRLGRIMNQKRIAIGTVFAINSRAQRDGLPLLVPGSHIVAPLPLYPLEIYNADDPANSAQFFMLRSNEVIAYADSPEVVKSLRLKEKTNYQPDFPSVFKTV